MSLTAASGAVPCRPRRAVKRTHRSTPARRRPGAPNSPAPQLIGTPRKRTISAREVDHGQKDTTIGRRPGGAERPHESGAAAPGRGGRMSRQRKTAAVLRLLRGEDLEPVSRALGVTAATLTGWRDAFVAAGEAALATNAATGEELESERLKAKLGRRDRARAAGREDRYPGGQPPFGPPEARP